MDKKVLLKRLGIGIAAAVVLYTLSGFLVVPMTAKWFINSRLEKIIGRPIQVDNVHFNPWTLAGGIEQLAVASHHTSDKNGDSGQATALLSVKALQVDLSGRSIFALCPIITQVVVDTPRLALELNADNTLNVSDIIQRFSGETASEPASAKNNNSGLPFRLSNVTLSGGQVTFNDRIRGSEHRIDNLSLTLPLVSGLAKERHIPAAGSLGFTLNGGAIAIEMNGLPFAEKPSAHLELKMNALALAAYLPYVSLPEGFVVQSPGNLDAALVIDYEDRESKPRIGVNGPVTLNDFSLGIRPQGTSEILPLAAMPKLSIQTAVDDYLSGGIKINSILADSPEVHLERTSEGELQSLLLLGKTDGSSETADKQSPISTAISPFPIDIGMAEIKNATVNFRDKSVSPEFNTKVKNAGLIVRNLKAGKTLTLTYALTAVSETVKQLSVKGEASVGVSDSGPAIDLKGNLLAEGILPSNCNPYYTPYIGDALDIGSVGIGADYQFGLSGGTPGGELSQGHLSVSDIRLADQKGDGPAVHLGNLNLSDIRLGLEDQTLVIGSVSSAQGRIRAVRDRKGMINIAQTIQNLPVMKTSGTYKTEKDKKDSEPTKEKRPAWDLKINRVAVDDYAISFSDKMHREPVNINVSDIKIRARPFGTDQANHKGDFTAQMTLKSGGKVMLDGTTDIPGAKANIAVRFNKVNFTTLQPYFSDYLNLTIGSGHIQAKGDVALGWADLENPVVSFQGEAGVNDFTSKSKVSGNDFFRCKTFYLGGMDVSVNPVKVHVREVSLTDFYKRAVLSKEGRLNISEIIVKKDVDTGEANRTAQAKTDPFPDVAIDTITIQGGHVNFTDYLTQPNFTANMTDITGSVTGLSSRGTKPATVRLKGLHGSHSPLDISGTIDPLKQTPGVDLGVSFKNIELPQFNAYAGKYLGYEIEKGKLMLDLKYNIQGTVLNSSNRIFFDQFTLGKRVESDDATSLPVELAVSLLKNSKGEIDLDVPVKGDLSDPEFSYGRVVFKTVSNLMLSIVKAPFKILGSLMGFGGEELGFVAFTPGDHTLDDDTRKKLDQLATLLVEKPKISLEILGRFDRDRDEAQLRAQRYNTLLAGYLTDTVSPEALKMNAVTPEQKAAALDAAYAAADFPKPKDASGKEMPIGTDEKEKLLITAISVTQSDLEALAMQRSERIQSYLMASGKIDPGRIFIHKPGPSEKKDADTHHVKTLFKLK
ncbi:MAG TPA: hypothetical protein DHV36_20305 [Desulfobacteraceae bacterium]|nr:hypothetical protein [Desulfobacteraceae bacterium]